MAYSKQNFVDGQVLTAAKLNAMDNALKEKADISIAKGTGTGAVIVGLISGESANTATGSRSYAEGYSTDATADNAHAEGSGTTASGRASHAEGSGSNASGINAHAEGSQTHAEGDYSHAEGANTTASGSYAHAGGSYTTASGSASHTEGSATTASGSNAHSEGWNTIANHKSQHVFGECNVADDNEALATPRGTYVEIVGNGTTKNERSNARTLDWSGNEALAGSLTLAKGTADEVTLTGAQVKALLALLNT